MQTIQETSLAKHISFEYSSFDRVVLRGYIQGLFVEGSVIKLLRNLGFTHHSNGVLRILTDKLNSHIKKVAENLGVPMHWWGEDEKNRYHSKIDFIQERYKGTLLKKNKRSKVIAIIRATENVRTFTNKDIRTRHGKLFTKSAKFANAYFERVLAKHHTIGLPDKLTEIFSLSRQKTNSKTTQNKYKSKAVIKHWLEGNSVKCYNKSGCLLRVETTINKPDLPGLKLKKPAINLMAYFWYGLGCNSRYHLIITNLQKKAMFGFFTHFSKVAIS